jgi:hypothetical protein
MVARLEPGGAVGEIPFGEAVDRNFGRAALFGAVRADPAVVENPEQPRLQIAALLEGVEPHVRVQQCVLQQVLGVGAAAGQPSGPARKDVQERLNLVGEARRDIGVPLRGAADGRHSHDRISSLRDLRAGEPVSGPSRSDSRFRR